MSDRRHFIKTTALVSAGLILNGCTDAKTETDPEKKDTSTGSATAVSVNKPIVLSTWKFGIQANEAAWGVLKNNGRALDAVEAGVKIPEADPTERSVGYGGRPDRDGRVTLDACIMDENANIGSVACLEHIKHPISVARAVMEKTPHVMLVGDGALSFALSQGFKKENLLVEESEKKGKNWLKTTNYNQKENTKITKIKE